MCTWGKLFSFEIYNIQCRQLYVSYEAYNFNLYLYWHISDIIANEHLYISIQRWIKRKCCNEFPLTYEYFLVNDLQMIRNLPFLTIFVAINLNAQCSLEKYKCMLFKIRQNANSFGRWAIPCIYYITIM